MRKLFIELANSGLILILFLVAFGMMQGWMLPLAVGLIVFRFFLTTIVTEHETD